MDGHTPVTMGRVAEELALNPSTVTRACDRLAALELMQKAENPLNKRETLLASPDDLEAWTHRDGPRPVDDAVEARDQRIRHHVR